MGHTGTVEAVAKQRDGTSCPHSTDPKWATVPVRALLVLTNHEVARWPMIYTVDIGPRPARARQDACTPAHLIGGFTMHTAH